MQLADHLRPLLRDHDCVIIPDFGGLVAEAAPARLQPGRQVLSPPAKQVAFNQALTRNDGLLLDALRQHLGVSAREARELLRQAVAQLHQELHDTNRTELPGVGVFRRAAGRGLSFEYTGHDNLLPAAYGLPELAVRPVRAADARPGRTARPAAPARRPASRRQLRPLAATVAVVGLLLSASYLWGVQQGHLPAAWRSGLPRWEAAASRLATPPAAQPQQANLAQPGWTTRPAALPTEPETQPQPEVAVLPLAGTVAAAVPAASPTDLPAASPATSPAAAAREKPALKATVTAVPATRPVPTTVPTAASAAAPAPKTVATPGPAAKPVPTAPAFATAIKGRTGRSYIIVGSYARLAQAEEGRQRLARAGYRTRVVLPGVGSRQYRVSAADFADEASAQREAARLRAHTRLGKSLWVLTN